MHKKNNLISKRLKTLNIAELMRKFKLTKLLSFMLLAFLLSPSKTYSQVIDIRVTKLVSCKEKANLKIDFRGNNDICLSNRGPVETICSNLTRAELTEIVHSQDVNKRVSTYKLNNIIEYLYSRGHRMKKRYTEGRDFCLLSVKR